MNVDTIVLGCALGLLCGFIIKKMLFASTSSQKKSVPVKVVKANKNASNDIDTLLDKFQ